MNSSAKIQKEVRRRIYELRARLRDANHQYFSLSASPMPDSEYDKLLRELADLEATHPEFNDHDSPTHRVGSDLSTGFRKVTHLFPMLSIQNTYSEAEVRDFHRQVTEKIPEMDLEYVCEPKIDGIAMSLVYENRRLKVAVTRGDGTLGDDVTRNILTIKSIPETLPASFLTGRLEVRGEVYMTKAEFLAYNEYSTRVLGKELQNPRNTASGSLKLKDPQETAKRPLRFFAYAILEENPDGSHWENLLRLEKAGFPVNTLRAKASNVDSVMLTCGEWEKQRDGLPYMIDGVVIKVNDLRQQAVLGRTAKSPKWVIAYKYKTEAAESVVESIDFQVGRTGVVTPVANLKPVQLGGTVVKRATLHNFDEIARLGLQVPDFVLVEKGGEIIPKIVKVLENKRPKHSRPIAVPKICPICSEELSKDEEEVAWRCDNLQCPAQVQRAILHFSSRGAMNIEHLGPALVDALLEKGAIRDTADIYSLKQSDLEALERMAEKSAANVLAAIEASKANGVEKLLFGLGIRFVGKTTALELSRHFKSLYSLRRASLEDLQAAPNVGERVAQSLHDYFSDPRNRKLLDRLEKAGLKTEFEAPSGSQPLLGQTWVITGTLPTWSRDEARDILQNAGAKVAESVSKKTTAVLVGESAGSKLDKAAKLGVKTMDEAEVKGLLGRE